VPDLERDPRDGEHHRQRAGGIEVYAGMQADLKVGLYEGRI
jgi:hypothetical protein